MKKTGILCMMILSAAALFAQPKQPPQPEQVTVTGKLALIQGRIALQSGQNVWYVAGIGRLVGFVDGLKEGAEVTLEGFTHPFPAGGAAMLWASKLTIAGRTYDLVPTQGPGSMYPGQRPGMGFMPNRKPYAAPGWGPGCDPRRGYDRNHDGRRGRR